MIEPTLLLAFLAGILTVFTPCVLPILPALLSGSVGAKYRPIAIVLGMTLTFTLVGVLVSVAGMVFAPVIGTLRFVAILFIIAMGALLYDDELNYEFMKLVGHLKHHSNKLTAPVTKGMSVDENSYIGAFLLGTSLGFVWLPCVGPILGAIFAFVAVEGNMMFGAAMLLTYSAGVSIPVLIIAYSGKSISGRISWFSRHTPTLKKAAGLIIMIAGLAMLFGIDTWLQAKLLPYFPLLDEILLEKF